MECLANPKKNHLDPSLRHQEIKNSEAQRFEIANQLITVIAGLKGEFSVRDILKRASLNNMMCSVFGRECQLASDESDELSRLVEEGYELLGKLNSGDHLPWLAGLDLQKVGSRCSKLVPKVNRFVNRIISEHRDRAQALANKDLVDVLLSLHGPDKLSDPDMVAVLWDGTVSQLEHVFIRGSKVRFMVIPDMLKNAPMFKCLESRIEGKGSAIEVGQGHAAAMRARAQAAGRGAPPGRGAVPSIRR
ncbi:Cytochrome P450 78A9 [Camellia lanceoleosa]|uniref:Cytochrome P450 78A9 n=1 Tax=Camellia lanceoleosa TaxID=1840588 RepID=A0ACC0FHH0_9ERIC|nr:Cytochrome P450 78A9 [Camellia lanceoleosa]